MEHWIPVPSLKSRKGRGKMGGEGKMGVGGKGPGGTCSKVLGGIDAPGASLMLLSLTANIL